MRARFDALRRVVPAVFLGDCGHWISLVTLGYAGNYEHEETCHGSWREAVDHALARTARWRRVNDRDPLG